MKRSSPITVIGPVHQKTPKSFSKVAALLHWADHIDVGKTVKIALTRVAGMKEISITLTSIRMI
jgi:hypothetical protein